MGIEYQLILMNLYGVLPFPRNANPYIHRRITFATLQLFNLGMFGR